MHLPELLATKLPPGSTSAVAIAARRYSLTPAGYLRAAVYEQLSRDGLCPDALAIVAPRIPAPTTSKAT